MLQRALPVIHLRAPEELLEQIAIYVNGDARQAYNTLEAAAAASPAGELTAAAVQDAMQRKTLLYDKGGEEYFNLISALHKSVHVVDADRDIARGSLGGGRLGLAGRQGASQQDSKSGKSHSRRSQRQYSAGTRAAGTAP